MASEIRIVIADDHPIVRSGLRQAIERDRHFEIVGEAGDGVEALAQITALRPAIVVLDIRMPRLDGFDVAREVRKQNLPVQLVFLTLHDSEDLLDSALELGARGYLMKASAVTEIVDGLRTVAAGKRYVSPALTGQLLERLPGQASSASSGLEALTVAERRVLRLVADYKSNKEIAAELYVHHRTVETHRANICEKLELRGHNALLRFALAHTADL
jgi:DNA-binding NarL/FixJ family response regulator